MKIQHLALAAALLSPMLPARADTIIAEWANIKPPPPPELKPVAVDPATTAFLVLDLVQQTCNEQRRPRCPPMIPGVQAFLGQARKAGMFVVYSLVVGSTAADILPAVAPAGDEPTVKSGVDKYFGTDLDALLRVKGIKTVVIVGTSAEGAVITTAIESVLRGYQVVLPVDGMAGETYSEQYTAWHLTHGPGMVGHVTLTTLADIRL